VSSLGASPAWPQRARIYTFPCQDASRRVDRGGRGWLPGIMGGKKKAGSKGGGEKKEAVAKVRIPARPL
jgi:hypothetical protein